ncbi:MAG: SDR family NAD(P)-dependent oxidoreductase [Actinobacteria bacterium]|nr:SDR family NAD(P)-dependent oxidoreductase [Actinomycetota bacterium]
MARKIAVVTGASSGIGAATAERLAAEGFELHLGARRLDRLEAVARPLGAHARFLDVTDRAGVAEFCNRVPACHVLINNAGGALGLEPVAEADESRWRWMFDANVLGTLRMTQALLPKIEASGDGHIVIVSSIAGLEVYEGGAGYTAAKHAETVLAETLRLELMGRPVRVTEINPGMVETEFSLVRFGGDQERAAQVYEGMTPLRAEDVADCIAWAVSRPSHVNIDRIVVKPREQVSATKVFRS